MNNFNNLDPKTMQALLQAAAGKLNTTPAELQKQLQNGTFDKALASMPQSDAQKLTQALSNKQTCEKILSSPQAQAIYKKLSES